MKAKLLTLLCLAAPAAFAAVSETPEELQSSGDLNGDGRQDLVIVDKVTGVYRVGYGQPGGSNFWVEARPSGIEHVTGLALGRALDTTRDALAFTSPDANRVNLLDASNPSAVGQPFNVFLGTVGPSRVVALDIGGAGNTAHADLYSFTIANSPPTPYHPWLTRLTGAGAYSDILPAQPNLTAEVVAAERVQLKTTGPQVAGLLSRTAPNFTFAAQALGSGVPVNIASTNNLPASDAFVFANFNGSQFNQFLFYQGGTSNLTLRPVLEPSVNDFRFGLGTTFTFGGALRQIVAIPGASDVRLLIIFGAGETAGVYSFDGTNAPTLAESFTADPGETFTGAAALGDGNMSLYSGTDGRSSSFQNWNRTGNGYTKGASGDLPKLNPLGNTGNVFLFVNQPFVSTKARLLGTLNAADWSSSLNLSDPAHVKASAEKYRNGTQGLGSPALKDLGLAPGGTTHGLANQIMESFSLLSMAPAIGKEVIDVKISPEPGRYAQGVSLKFSFPQGTNGLAVYRLGPNDNWKPWLNQPVPIFKDTVVSYYAMVAGGNKSAIRTAAYTFDTPATDVDSDGDGVPDFVELGLGGKDADLHSKDADGDGHSDLAEALGGTNPYSTNSVSGPRPDELSAFTWLVTPRPLAAIAPGLTGCSNGTVVSAFDLHGGLLHSAPAIPWSYPYAKFTNMFADISKRLYVAATEPHYDVRTNSFPFTTNTDTRIGREMLLMQPVPEFPTSLEVNYTYGGGSLATEAANWIAAAQAAEAAIVHPTNQNSITHLDTLAALLTERKIGELLVTRGLLAPTNPITLFPFRPQDADRINPPATNILSLETNLVFETNNLPDPAYPGHKITNIWHRVNQFVLNNGSVPATQLRALAHDIYRISALSNNVAPGQYPSPVDTLRGFIEAGALHSNYLAATTLDANDLSAAVVGVAQALAGVSSRPTTHLVLKVRADSFSANGCTILETLTGGLKSLVVAGSAAYKFPEAFQLVPDSMVEVHAYTDLSPTCGAQTLDVITLNVFAFPAVSPEDLNGNLLADSWEDLYLLNDPNGDADGDGVKNLQEFLDGTDPLNALSAGAPVDLTPPQMTIESGINSQLKMTWFFPEPYASKFNFGLQSTDGIGQAFVDAQTALQDLAGGNFQLLLPNPGTPAKFYRLKMSLK